MKEPKIFSAEHKLIVINDGDYYFHADIAFIGNGKYMCRGVDLDKNVTSDLVIIEDDNPAHKFADYLELLVSGRLDK